MVFFLLFLLHVFSLILRNALLFGALQLLQCVEHLDTKVQQPIETVATQRLKTMCWLERIMCCIWILTRLCFSFTLCLFLSKGAFWLAIKFRRLYCSRPLAAGIVALAKRKSIIFCCRPTLSSPLWFEFCFLAWCHKSDVCYFLFIAIHSRDSCTFIELVSYLFVYCWCCYCFFFESVKSLAVVGRCNYCMLLWLFLSLFNSVLKNIN